MMVFLDHRKDRTIRGLQAPVGIGAIKGTRITVGTVFTDKATMTRLILQDSLNTDLVEII